MKGTFTLRNTSGSTNYFVQYWHNGAMAGHYMAKGEVLTGSLQAGDRIRLIFGTWREYADITFDGEGSGDDADFDIDRIPRS